MIYAIITIKAMEIILSPAENRGHPVIHRMKKYTHEVKEEISIPEAAHPRLAMKFRPG